MNATTRKTWMQPGSFTPPAGPATEKSTANLNEFLPRDKREESFPNHHAAVLFPFSKLADADGFIFVDKAPQKC
jgi:hypothetical protein